MDKTTEKLTCIDSKAFVQLCQLLQAQLKLAFRQSDHSVDTLSKQFVQLMEELHQIAESGDNSETNQRELKALTEASKKTIQSIIIAFQFYDRLSQQVGHVTTAIALFEQLLQSGEAEINAGQLEALFHQIRSAYTTVEEKETFDHVFSGSALAQLAKGRTDNNEATDDIELF